MFSVPKPRKPTNQISIETLVDGRQYRSLREYIDVQSALQRMGWSQERLRPEGPPVELRRARYIETSPRLQ
jgi:hypothetical protein